MARGIYDRLSEIYGTYDLDGLDDVMACVSNVDDELKYMADKIQTFIDGELETANVDEIRDFLTSLKDNLKEQAKELY